MTVRIGVDTGGTFTDVCLYDEDSTENIVVKVPSTPADPGEAVLLGVRAALARHLGANSVDDLSVISYFAHGTTVATNALLEGTGARVGLITTVGLRDLLELGRQTRPKLYDLQARKPVDIVPRERRLEIAERLDYTGAVSIEVDLDDIRAQATKLRDQGVDAVAVCLLYSYLNPLHEERVREIVREVLPDAFLSVSHEVLPEFREFERFSTTVINAFVGPIMQGYLGRLRTALHEQGLGVVPRVTQSNGGVLTFEQAEGLPVRTALSGPSTGVVGAAELAAQSGHSDIITFDMGGTSSDIALINDAKPVAAHGTILDGRPIRVPMLDISTVGAGGGSIAWVDDGGHLKVGPRSAGAVPGPACYGLGEEPTVTDANVVLGILHQERLLGGEVKIDAARSYRAVETLAAQLGTSVYETAQGIVSVVTANMAKAIRVISVKRGYNPADYAMVAFGGAGPLHASRLGAELGVGRVLVPPRPGALSAIGMLMTDLRADFTRTAITQLSPNAIERIDENYAQLRIKAREWLAMSDDEGGEVHLALIADARYVGQNYEISIDVSDGLIDGAWIGAARERFEVEHKTRYGYLNSGSEIELVTYRLEVTRSTPKARSRAYEATAEPVEAAIVGERSVYLPEAGGMKACPVFDRDLLRPGQVVTGPALLDQYDTTTLVLPGYRAEVDAYLMLDIHAEEAR